ncbi:transmembrane protease serine 3-like [Tubulanus polymorphus]|uniref:transmembrane protease serine 3-like n=1 Tax=Tubulanus polymorphus TaxID=672921 RepID=UPI003DA57713
MFRSAVTILLIIETASTCFGFTTGKGDWRIISGTNSIEKQWPWQVTIQYAGKHVCGGTIIDSLTILSAAHCFRYGEPSDYEVGVGIIFNMYIPDDRRYHVTDMRQHDSYKKVTKGFDIMIIKVDRPIQFDKGTSAVPLPRNVRDSPKIGDVCYVSGWGYSDLGHTILPTRLQHVDVEIVPNSVCQLAYGKYDIYDSQICAGGQTTKNACHGDSGGPLVCMRDRMFKLYGVVSWGARKCGQIGVPGIYTRVTSYLDWIKQNRH